MASNNLQGGLSDDVSSTYELRNQVLENNLIRDKIFNYAFSFFYNPLDHADILKCRLIDHAWLRYITESLHKSGVPLFTIDFSDFMESNDKISGSYVLKKTSRLKDFMDTWLTFPGSSQRIPLFKLNFDQHRLAKSIKRDRINDLVECLSSCGGSLFDISLDISKTIIYDDNNVASSIDILSNIGQLHFPYLVSLQIILSFDHDKQLVSSLLQPILLGCERLKCFSLLSPCSRKIFPMWKFMSEVVCLSMERIYFTDISNYDKDDDEVPYDGSYFTIHTLLSDHRRLEARETEYLPVSLETIKIDEMASSELLRNLLLKNNLPNLTKLMLHTREKGFNDTISQIMERFATQLKVVLIDGNFRNNYVNTEKEITSLIIKFPVMTKLNALRIFSVVPEFGITQSFPVLKTLSLKCQATYMMQGWADSLHYGSLSELNCNIDGLQCPDNLMFTLELSHRLCMSYPHLTELRIAVGNVEDGSVGNIFHCMTMLKKLYIRLDKACTISNASIWNGIILGVSPKLATTLAASPREQWPLINLQSQRSKSRSIINLQNLTTFGLGGRRFGRTNLLISDISFYFGFLQIPSLKNLYLLNIFRVSTKMRREWIKRGNNIFVESSTMR